MNIAIIAWGSVVWDPQDLPIKGNWRDCGPTLPIEFSRISNDARLTLVIDEDNGVPVCTKYAISGRSVLHEAVNDLRIRERTSDKYIGWLNFVHNTYSQQVYPEQASVQSAITAWGIDSDIDGVVWTALPPSFEKELGIPFSVEAAAKYITSLPCSVRNEALRYIHNAPNSVKTPFRLKIDELQEADILLELSREIDRRKLKIKVEQQLKDTPIKAGLHFRLDGHDVCVGDFDPSVGLWKVFREKITILVQTSILEKAYWDSVAKEVTTPNRIEYLSRFRPKNMTIDEENKFEKR